MNIMEFGAIGELLAGVAMVATLMYLAIQIRHSASLAQGTAERGLMEAVQTMTDRLARNPKIWQQGLRSFDTVPSQDQLIFTSMFNPWVSHLERALRMRSCGLEPRRCRFVWR